MSDYRRFVAYVYEYQKGKKGRNCGFIQVEAKDRSCRMEVHLLCPGLIPDVKCEIFSFVRNGGLIDGILTGVCITENSRADCVLETDRTSIGGSGIPLEKTGGMILITENGGFFGTEWDDKIIRPDNFRRMDLPKETVLVEEPENAAAEGPEEAGEAEKPENEIPENIEEPENAVAEGPEGAEKSENEIPENVEEPENAVAEGAGDAEKSENKIPEEVLSTQSIVESPVQEKHRQEQTSFSFGEPVEAFEDGEIFDCRKIQIRDLCRLQPRDCALRNNRFLQYGFYNFGHLLLGKNRSGHYILGVPGGYDQQEQFMANMFGFSCFRESRQIRLPKCRGGYWYRLINPPKLH